MNDDVFDDCGGVQVKSLQKSIKKWKVEENEKVDVPLIEIHIIRMFDADEMIWKEKWWYVCTTGKRRKIVPINFIPPGFYVLSWCRCCEYIFF